MIKCVKGEITLNGNIAEICAELVCTTRCIAERVCEHDNEKFTARFKSAINNAIALGFGEKTEEEACYKKDDDKEHDGCAEDLHELLKMLVGLADVLKKTEA